MAIAEFEVPKSMAQKPWAAPGVEGEEAGMGSGQGRSHTAGGAIVGARSRARMRLSEQQGLLPQGAGVGWMIRFNPF
jgi:hypothetical protein